AGGARWIETDQARRAHADRDQRGVGTGRLLLWRDAVGSVGELIYAPELRLVAGEGRHRLDLEPVIPHRQRTIGAGDPDAVIRGSEVSAGTFHRSDGPVLVRPDHVRREVDADIAFRPYRAVLR